MRLKRLISCLLSAALLAGLLVFPPASASGSGGFSDISDSTVADAAEMLRLLGVVDGTGGGAFNPGGTLSRAEFCKMTVEIMGRGAEEPAQRNRTIFTDVGPTYWARGYVNLASSITIGGTAGENGGTTGGTRLIMGVGDGTFRPNQAITYGEAVTILMRVLGYGSADVATGSNWYDGYVAVAQSSGLADGLSLGGAATLTRGQAAILFYNLLFTEPKDSDQVYLTTLGGSLEDNVVVLSTDATADDGTTGSVLTTSGTYKTDRVSFPGELNGTRGQLVLDKNKKLLAVLPEEGSTFRSVTVMAARRPTPFLCWATKPSPSRWRLRSIPATSRPPAPTRRSGPACAPAPACVCASTAPVSWNTSICPPRPPASATTTYWWPRTNPPAPTTPSPPCPAARPRPRSTRTASRRAQRPAPV